MPPPAATSFPAFRGPHPDEPAILGLIDAVVYDWNVADDTLRWGANVGHVLKDFPCEALATGAAFAQCEATDQGPSRGAHLLSAAGRDQGEGVPYSFCGLLRAPNGALLEIVDFGRRFMDPIGRPARAHGLLRVIKTHRDAEAGAIEKVSGPTSRPELIAAILAQAASTNFPERRFAVAVIGVDGFEAFNARRGFQAGDDLLDEVGRRIAKRLRAGDGLARHSGATFLALLAMGPKDTGEVAAQKLAERLNDAPFDIGGIAERVTLRIGLALGAGRARGAEALIQQAEEALVEAAAEGASFAGFEAGEARRAARRREMDDLSRLNAAIDTGSFALAYQPIRPLSAGQPIIYEGLARLVDAEGATISPAAWLALAERHGRIAEIDQLIVRCALAKLIARPDVTLSINVSPLTLRQPAFLAELRATLTGRPALARRLVIEIVETAALHDVEAIAESFADLRALGLRLAMDDFGAGHTSLKNLRALKADIVKIDGAFVQNLARSSDDRFYVRELIALARRIGAKIVAEWVEDSETLAMLRAWGCDYAQGHHTGAPDFAIPREEDAIAAVA